MGAMAASDRRRVRTDMELWNEIRRQVLVEGVSKRQVCREYGLGWRTLEKMLDYPEPPGYRRRVPRGRPKLGAFVGVIDGILARGRGSVDAEGAAADGQADLRAAA